MWSESSDEDWPEELVSSSEPKTPPRRTELSEELGRWAEAWELGREWRSIFEAAVGEVAERVGMKRSPFMRIVVLEAFERFFTGVWPTVEPVPVSAHSDTPRSRRSGERDLAMLDLGEVAALGWGAVTVMAAAAAARDLEDLDEAETLRDSKAAISELDLVGLRSTCHSGSWWRVRGGVKGELLAAARARGEGVRGMRPPAVREEKREECDLRGVCTAAVAIADVDIDIGSRDIQSRTKKTGSAKRTKSARVQYRAIVPKHLTIESECLQFCDVEGGRESRPGEPGLPYM